MVGDRILFHRLFLALLFFSLSVDLKSIPHTSKREISFGVQPFSSAEARRKRRTNRNTGSRRITEYYTMINNSLVRRDCRGEGNQIVNGVLYGSNCKPANVSCKYGVGVRNICIEPCRHGAGGKNYRIGQKVCFSPREQKICPSTGRKIECITIADRGGGVNGSAIDIFMGMCKKRSRQGTCLEYAHEAYAHVSSQRSRQPASAPRPRSRARR